jgi:hypothetical protein
MKPRDWRSSGYDWLFILRYGLFGRLEEVDVEMLRVGVAGEVSGKMSLVGHPAFFLNRCETSLRTYTSSRFGGDISMMYLLSY